MWSSFSSFGEAEKSVTNVSMLFTVFVDCKYIHCLGPPYQYHFITVSNYGAGNLNMANGKANLQHKFLHQVAIAERYSDACVITESFSLKWYGC